MAKVITIGLDIAKNVFQAHGADARGQQVFSCRISRSKVLEFFARRLALCRNEGRSKRGGRAGMFASYRLRVAHVLRDHGLTDLAEESRDRRDVHDRN